MNSTINMQKVSICICAISYNPKAAPGDIGLTHTATGAETYFYRQNVHSDA